MKNILFIVMLIAFISGCTSITRVENVLNDSNYSYSNFSVNNLKVEVLNAIPKDSFEKKVKHLKVITKSLSHNNDGAYSSWVNTNEYAEYENGLFLHTVERHINDIATLKSYGISYRGMVDLRWQELNLGAKNTKPLYEIKRVHKFESLPDNVGKTMEVNYEYGNSQQLMNFYQYKQICTIKSTIEASKLNPKLHGDAFLIDCDSYSNGAVTKHSQRAFLKDYGIGIEVEGHSANYKTNIVITDIIEY